MSESDPGNGLVPPGFYAPSHEIDILRVSALILTCTFVVFLFSSFGDRIVGLVIALGVGHAITIDHVWQEILHLGTGATSICTGVDLSYEARKYIFNIIRNWCAPTSVIAYFGVMWRTRSAANSIVTMIMLFAVFNALQTMMLQECPPGSHWDVDRGGCCPKDYTSHGFLSNGTAVCCPNGSWFDDMEKICVEECPDGSVYDDRSGMCIEDLEPEAGDTEQADRPPNGQKPETEQGRPTAGVPARVGARIKPRRMRPNIGSGGHRSIGTILVDDYIISRRTRTDAVESVRIMQDLVKDSATKGKKAVEDGFDAVLGPSAHDDGKILLGGMGLIAVAALLGTMVGGKVGAFAKYSAVAAMGTGSLWLMAGTAPKCPAVGSGPKQPGIGGARAM